VPEPGSHSTPRVGKQLYNCSTATLLNLLFQSFQFSMLTWKFKVAWPEWMSELTAWLANIVIPDVAGESPMV
jgi:hypothetical protein